MKTATATEKIDVQALRVGMFVHLDVGWMSHPFPLSSFRITSAQQLATIRSLGLAQVRWSPRDSALPDDAPAAADDAGGAANDPRIDAEPDDGGPDTVPDALMADAADAADPADDAASIARRAAEEHQRRLARQRDAQARVERQYAEAARACRHTIDLVPGKPHDARAQAEALAQALTSKMIGEQDLCIRVLTEAAGDKASMHAMNVAIVSLLMGRCFGYADEELRDLGVGAMLHDIGKIDMPARLRHREDNFSPSETRFYEEHVELGLVQARRMGLSPGATAVIAQHHEHADGSGFPAKLNSDRMTMAARIVALVNRYDNLCNPHLLARAMTPHESLSLLFAQGRSKYDTSILGAFIKMMGVYPPGSTVQLTDDRYAIVVAVNSTRPLKPQVLVHEKSVQRDQALVLDLETVPGLGIRRSIRPQQLPPNVAEYLAPTPRVAYFFEPSVPVERDDAPMNNPLPVEPFSVAEAARRTWPLLIEAMLDAVCLVEPEGLRIVAANAAAGRLYGVAPAELVGRDMLADAATPEDEVFWAETAATRGQSTGIVSESCVLHADGAARPVLRRVSRIEPAPGNALYVVALHDRSRAVQSERTAEVTAAVLAATLESVDQGVLVTDLAGHISHFNRRFATLWELPEEMLLLRADDEIFDWMRTAVAEPAAYLRRLAEIEAAPEQTATDLLTLRSGDRLERSVVPQQSRGRTIGRAYSFRRLAPVC